MNCLPKIALADAVAAFRNLSHQPDGPWLVQLADGRCAEAVRLLSEYQQAAKAELRGRDAETDVFISIWGDTLARWRPTRNRWSARSIGSPSAGCCGNSANRKKFRGAIPG